MYSGGDESDEDIFQSHNEERVQLLKGTSALNRASGHLHRTKQVSAQTDEIAVGIIGELEQQKDSLIRTRNRFADIDQGTDRSRALIATIACKTIQNRLILIIVIILEALVLFAVLFYKLYKRFH